MSYFLRLFAFTLSLGHSLLPLCQSISLFDCLCIYLAGVLKLAHLVTIDGKNENWVDCFCFPNLSDLGCSVSF